MHTGTMTFGKQNTLEEGVEQLTRAFGEYGINCCDTAEVCLVFEKLLHPAFGFNVSLGLLCL